MVDEGAKETTMTNEGVTRSITIDELKEHDGKPEPWFVVNDEVYDGTGFLKEHPGDMHSNLGAAGMDSSDEFMAIRMFGNQTPAYLVLIII